MRPILFRWWNGKPVYSYPAMLYAGLTIGLVVGDFEANLRGQDGTRFYIAAVLLVVPALLGARLLYVARRWAYFRRDLALIVRRTVGGQVMYGGLLAVPVSVPLVDALGLPFWGFWDAATFTLLAAMMLTRVGCLLHGCCLGKTTAATFGLVIRGHDGVAVRRVPAQLLEAGLAAVLLGCVAAIPAEAPGGVVFLSATGGYAVGRFFLEGTREQAGRVTGAGAQRTASALLGTVAIVFLTLLL
jgi:phosphatidylglycerol:prolipoprotein diacylglycerol transferase